MSNITEKATVELFVNGEQAEQAMTRLKARADELTKAIDDAKAAGKSKKEIANLQRELDQVNKELTRTESKAKGAKIVLDDLSNTSIHGLKNALRYLEKEIKMTKPNTEQWKEYAEQIRAVRERIAELNEELAGGSSPWEKFKEWSVSAWPAIDLVKQGYDVAIGTMREYVDAYASMDQEMANVRKFTGLTEEQVADLNEEFKKMDTRTSREGLNKLAQEAGRLGKTSKEDILGFVSAADKINVALDDLGEGATLTLSKLTGVFGIEGQYGTEQSLLKVGSVINELSQNCSASAPYLAQFASRMGGVGAQANMTIPQIMAFGAVLDSNNQAVEASSTALQQVIVRMMQEPAKYAKVAGLDVKKFSDMLKTDVNGALIMFLETLQSAGGMDVLSPMFKDMGENGSRAISALSTLATHIDEVKAQQIEANKAFAEGTSIDNEFAVQNTTVQAALDKAKNAANELRIELGEKLSPIMAHVISSTSAMAKAVSVLVNFCFEHKSVIITLTTAIASYYAAVGLATVAQKAWSAAMLFGKNVVVAFKYVVGLCDVGIIALTHGTRAAGTAFTFLNQTMKANPFGLVISLVATLTLVISRLFSKTEDLNSKMRDAIKVSFQYNEQMEKELTTLDKLIGALEGATEGTEEYDKAKDAILSKYGAYLDGLVSEEGKIIDLEKAYRRLAESIRIANEERGIAESRKAVDDAYFEEMSDLQKKLSVSLVAYGADQREAARLAMQVSTAMSSNRKLSDEVVARINELSRNSPSSEFAQGFLANLVPSSQNSSIGEFFGVKQIPQPSALINSMYSAKDIRKTSLNEIDIIERKQRPLGGLDDNMLDYLLEYAQNAVNNNGGTVIRITDALAGTFEMVEVSAKEAQKQLEQLQGEKAYRNGSAASKDDQTGTDFNEPKSPTSPTSPHSSGKTDRFAEEEVWKKRMLAENRILYATGQKDYQQYYESMDSIELEYLDRKLSHTDLTAEEQLAFQAEYYEKYLAMQDTFLNGTKEEEGRRYDEAVTALRQRFIDEEMTTKQYNEAMRLLELEHYRNLSEIADRGSKDAVGKRMNAMFNGNVDLTARPEIPVADLKEKGWSDAGEEGTATVFSSQYGIMDASGQNTEILVTPILPDGTVLSESELEDYIYNTLQGAEDILQADTKGIVISVGVSEDGSAGEMLHRLQEMYYMHSESEAELKNRQQANERYAKALFDDEERRRQETEKAEEEHLKRMEDMKSRYFGDSQAEKLAKYDADLEILEQVYERELQATENNAAEKLRIEEAFEQAKLALRKQYGLYSENDTRNAMERGIAASVKWLESDGGKAVTDAYGTVTSGMSAIFSQMSTLVQAELDIQTSAINKKYDREIELAQGNSYKVAKLEKQKEKEIAKVKNEANKKMFAMQVFQAVAQTAQNALNAYGSAAAVPVVGYILAPIAAAMAVAAGAVQIASIKKQQQASEAQGYSKGGFTRKGAVNEPAGIVHAGEWVASQKLLASPVARPMIEALDYAQRTNTIGRLRADDVSRSITASNSLVRIAESDDGSAVMVAAALKLAASADSMTSRLSEPFVTVATVTGDKGINKAQDDYSRMINNVTPKSKRKK